MEAARTLTSPLGRITISSEAIAQIVANVTAESYGVVGLSARGLGRLLPAGRTRGAIEVARAEDGVRVDLHVVVEYGLNLAEVASTLTLIFQGPFAVVGILQAWSLAPSNGTRVFQSLPAACAARAGPLRASVRTAVAAARDAKVMEFL